MNALFNIIKIATYTIVSMTVRDVEPTDKLNGCGIYQQVEAITGKKYYEILNVIQGLSEITLRFEVFQLILHTK